MHLIVLAIGFFIIYCLLADRNEKRPYKRTKAQNDYLKWRRGTKHIGREDWLAYRKEKKKRVKGWD